MPRPAIVLLMLMALWRTAHVSQVHLDNQTLPELVASSALIVIGVEVPDSVVVAASPGVSHAGWDEGYRVERVLRSPGGKVGALLRVCSYNARIRQMMSHENESPIVPGYRPLEYPLSGGSAIYFFSFRDSASGIWYETASGARESVDHLDAVQAAIDAIEHPKIVPAAK